MIKRFISPLLAFAVLAMLLFTECTQQRQPCIQPTIITLRFGAYQVVYDTATNPLTHFIDSVKQVVDTVLPSPYVGPIRSDTGVQLFLYDSISGQGSKFAIILSNLYDSCMYRINASTIADFNKFDTLTFYYQRKPSFLSNACGYTLFYNLLSVNCTHQSIDSVVIENSSVTSNVNVEHLKVYFKNR